MAVSDERDAVAQYSAGAISRAELARALGQELSFGDALLLLRNYGLPLPNTPSDPASIGVQLVRRASERRAHG